MTKEPNVYSFADECYVYYGDYKKDLEQKDKEIERLSKEVDMWNKKYNEQIDIINELEKESHLGMLENQNNNDYAKGLYCAYEYINKKIKELKEGK